ncbi:MAG: hypothetical protein COW28_02845 [bacterium (Candidatus Ratteibacteria) CG15_BIG_FIL_POST_REV_8_21_14_020_41_12]|uniref:Radical SAM protein n=1 Tax=bacterium (Candidatus Ratteibacteria) CG15_BIG_FIL_POST_REV_8_21_14_020_41_12 TaxID=2014291 RepID=A0A2M7GZ45_9BACT|nr:MAG: hypothetical protein COW28_02845 [bacterium (Candidatus Ratteibacteria) CG15_BIG_FIL_POST_REV_8_21_14_020_41_12]
MYPRYLPLYQNGILSKRVEESYHILESCHLCPRDCSVNRLKEKKGIAKKGLLIRHLILPNSLAKSENVLKFIAKEISKNTYIALMTQYFPANRAPQIPELNRRISREEYNKVLDFAHFLGLNNILQQEI